MPPKQPVLGSLAFQSPPANSRLIQITPSLCHDLSLFKELMKEYRKLDDTVTMRLNRTVAQFRDRDTQGTFRTNLQDEACAFFWKELVDNWKTRADIIKYCVDIIDKDSPRIADRQRQKPDEGSEEEAEKNLRTNGLLSYADEVKRNQIRIESTVETIVRRRSLDAFKSRCRYFEPPLTDLEARKWWEAAGRET